MPELPGRAGRGPTRLGLFPSFPLSAVRRRPGPLPFPLEHPNCRLYYRARQGLWHGVRALGLGIGDEILVPAYHQGAEVEAFVRAGLTCRFYDTTADLEPSGLDSLITPATRALHLIHYWGFPQNADRWRTWCNEHNLLLIEDGAQAFLARWGGVPVGTDADLAVFCLYKAFGLPDGAAAICRAPLPEPSSPAGSGLGGLARRVGSAAAQRSAAAASLQRRLGSNPAIRPMGEFLEGEFDLADPGRPPSRATRWALGRVVVEDAADRRRANYRWLLERLGRLVPPAFADPGPGASPIAFPIEPDDRDRLARRLHAAGIDTGVLWPTWHPDLDVAAYPVARSFRERVLALPVHQDLTREQLDRIARAVGVTSQ